MWRGTLHHVTNVHEWDGHPTDDNLSTKMTCDHQSIETERTDKKWLESGSKPHDRLTDLVLDPKLLKVAPSYLTFR